MGRRRIRGRLGIGKLARLPRAVLLLHAFQEATRPIRICGRLPVDAIFAFDTLAKYSSQLALAKQARDARPVRVRGLWVLTVRTVGRRLRIIFALTLTLGVLAFPVLALAFALRVFVVGWGSGFAALPYPR